MNLFLVFSLLLVCSCKEELLWKMRWKRGLVCGARGGSSGMTRKTAAGMNLGLCVWSAGKIEVLCVGDGYLGLRWGDRGNGKGGSLGVRGGSSKQDCAGGLLRVGAIVHVMCVELCVCDLGGFGLCGDVIL